MFNNLSLRTKLISAFAFCALTLTAVGTFALMRLSDVNERYGHVTKINMPSLAAMNLVGDAARRVNVVVATVGGTRQSEAELKELDSFLNKALSDMEQGKKEYLSLPFSPGERELWDAAEENLGKVADYGKRTLALSWSTKPEAIKQRDEMSVNYDSVRAPWRAAFEKLRDFQNKEALQWATEAEETGKVASRVVLIVVAVGALVALLLGLFISASIARTMTRVADQLSSGADEVTAAATEISSTSEQLSASAAEQASSIQETASAIEEMSSMVKQNADNATKSSDTARSGQESASKGKQVIDEMLGAMNEIDAANREIAEVLKVIGQISNKTKVIDDIVFKTQLLSFNASVEAARAGEHGKGFAVVAEEVGNLAQMSGVAAAEISQMLEQSLDRVERMITASKQKVEVGINVGKRCGEVLDELVGSVSEVNGMSNEIASACKEQSRGITEITRAMNQLDQVTQQNASASQQSATAAEQLSQQAETLRASVGILMQLLNGNDQPITSVHRPANEHSAVRTPAKANVKHLANRKTKLAANGTAKSVNGVPSGKSEGFDEAA